MIVVWFSSGAASAVAAKISVDRYGPDVRVVNNPVAEEDEDNRRFMRDVSEWIGVEIEEAINPEFPDASAESVWAKRRYMSGVSGAPCTGELKKKARKYWEWENEPDAHVLGFTAEEEGRHRKFVENEGREVIPVLIEEGITKQKCIEILLEAGIRPPRVYRMGYPNANCIGCVKATSPTYWNHVRHVHPDVFQRRAEQSREIGAKLVRYKGERIYLDELPEGAKGNSMKSMDFECGIFCKGETDHE